MRLRKGPPDTIFTCIDLSEKSLATTNRLKEQAGFKSVTFQRDNITRLSFADETFDDAFVCFVLEHLEAPVAVLTELKRVLRTGGTITVIEGTTICASGIPTPDSVAAWNGLITAQSDIGHDPNTGRRLAPLLMEAGFNLRTYEPALDYADRLKPDLRDGMVDHIIVPMVQSAEQQILADNLVPKQVYEQGIADLSQLDRIDEGTFFYTWFKAVAQKGGQLPTLPTSAPLTQRSPVWSRKFRIWAVMLPNRVGEPKMMASQSFSSFGSAIGAAWSSFAPHCLAISGGIVSGTLPVLAVRSISNDRLNSCSIPNWFEWSFWPRGSHTEGQRT